MRIIDIVSEARRNPDHPSQKATRINPLDKLKEYTDGNKEYFVTFSDLPRTGINPQSEFKTPIGIYCYPLSEFRDLVHDATETVDIFTYAADRPFMYILEEKNKPLQEIEDYDEDDWEKDKEKLKDMFDISDNEIEDIIANHRMSSFNGKPIAKLWKITRRYASYSEKSHVTWNKLLLDLGYSGFVDSGGLGIIHVNEPTQAFFLSTKFYKVKDKLLNKYGTHDHQYYDKMKTIDDSRKKIIKLYKTADTTEKKLNIIDNYFDNDLILYMDNMLTDEEKYKLISEYYRRVYTVSDRVLKKIIKNDDPKFHLEYITKLSTRQQQYIINNLPDWYEILWRGDVKILLNKGVLKLSENAKKNLAESKKVNPEIKLNYMSLQKILQYDIPNNIIFFRNKIEEINKFTDKEFKKIHPNVMKQLISLVSEDKYSDDSSKEFLRKAKSIHGKT